MSKKLENNSKFFNVAKIRDIILLLLINDSTVCKNPITIPNGAGKLKTTKLKTKTLITTKNCKINLKNCWNLQY